MPLVQHSFARAEHYSKKKITRKQVFLTEMEQIVPWQRLVSTIEPFYPKAGNGRPPMPLDTMLRIYFLQNWYNYGDPDMEDALYDSETLRHFALVDLNSIPDETTILNFRHLLDNHDLNNDIFVEVNAYIAEHGLLLKQGSSVDATLLVTSSSTKNKDKKRDPEMSSTRKNNNYYFGAKLHIGADSSGKGIVHNLELTPANISDSEKLEDLLHGEEQAVFGDKGYAQQQRKARMREQGIFYGIMDKNTTRRKLSNKQKRRNKRLASLRAKVEHPFRVLKQQFGYRRLRYKGIAKNYSRLKATFALINLYLCRKALQQQKPSLMATG